MPTISALPLEELHLALVLLGGFKRRKCSEISSLTGRGVFFP
jgi:hypothetical protein